jgi:hypothetical protein
MEESKIDQTQLALTGHTVTNILVNPVQIQTTFYVHSNLKEIFQLRLKDLSLWMTK